MRRATESRVALLLSIALSASSFARLAHAYPGAPIGPVSDAAKAEAKERFDKALALFDEKDFAGALAEFRRAYELTGNLVVLYNIGLVHDALGQYVQADDALTEVLQAQPDPLRPEWRARATEARTHARGRIGTIELSATTKEPPGATPSAGDPLVGAVIELDGVDVGRWPLAAPLRASIGPHVVGILAEGFAPARKEASVAGEASTKLAFELVPMAGKVAQLKIVSSIVRAQIVVDGQVVGVTPLPTTLPLPPGRHVIELKRAGYVTASTVLELSAGAIGEAKLEPREDANEVATLGTEVAVRTSEEASLVTIDGSAHEAFATIRIPPGPHHLHVEKTGFRAFDRDFDAAAGSSSTLSVDLIPTPETLADHDASVSRHRTWGIVGLATGAVFAGIGAVFFVGYGKNKSDLDRRDVAWRESYQGTDVCSGRGVVDLGKEQCDAIGAQIDSERASNKNKLYVALGAGAVSLIGFGVGLYSFLSAPNSDRFDKVRAHASTPMQMGVIATPSSYGLTLGGAF